MKKMKLKKNKSCSLMIVNVRAYEIGDEEVEPAIDQKDVKTPCLPLHKTHSGIICCKRFHPTCGTA